MIDSSNKKGRPESGWPLGLNITLFQISLGIPVCLFAGEDDDFHFFSLRGFAVAIGMASPIRGKDDFNLVELSAGGTGDSQLAGGFRKFNFNHLRTGIIAAAN